MREDHRFLGLQPEAGGRKATLCGWAKGDRAGLTLPGRRHPLLADSAIAALTAGPGHGGHCSRAPEAALHLQEPSPATTGAICHGDSRGTIIEALQVPV